MKAPVLGIDIGGSAVKLGLVAIDGSVRARRELRFEPGLDFDTFVDRLAAVATDCRREAGEPVCAIGVALPGYVDPDTGISLDGTDNVPILRGRSLPAALEQRFGLPAFAQNDGVAATLGERLFGAGRAFENFLMLTIGTGIGGGLVLDGRLVIGARGEPPEFGAMVLDAEGPMNYSGIAGTLEAFAAVPGLNRAYGGQSDLPAKEIFGRAAAGEAAAAAAIDAVCRRIAQACGILINTLNLEACVLGGGVSNAGEPLLDAVRRHLPDFTWPRSLARCEICLAEKRNEAGIVGAAVHAAAMLGRAARARDGIVHDSASGHRRDAAGEAIIP
ncbi:ROK family protein [Oceanibacterium hippocampi]|uniref:Beta-glucoside kinase n=1 Tax=Oceanibacterium hippocampi TaxID=745714 RepID=A0A1Y5TXK9_9PROT|nr:ROK family protein [Oceanibacterium hippocampi]SLN75831.1 Beta-glucoside kinase [Oceanibacterium hippocampi]